MLELSPVLEATRLDQTARAIEAVQLPSGAIPECPEGLINPWNHVEAAMALDVAGRHEAAARAYAWSRSTQREDGAWPAGVDGRDVVDGTLDANFAAYIAFGVWHHYVATSDRGFLEGMWTTVSDAIGFVLRLQRADGTIAWARDHSGRAWPGALLTSCSCISMSLRAAISIARELGREQPAWQLARARLQDALSGGDHLFESRERFSMDWYYPVIARAVEGAAAETRLDRRWDDFVIAGRGVRCVSDRPWVTAGETAELVLALHVMGRIAEAHLLLEWVQHLRTEEGDYWIGATSPEGIVWPRQKPTWGSGSVVLAADALAGGAFARCL